MLFSRQRTKLRVDEIRLSGYMPRHRWESHITASSNAPSLLKVRS